MRMLSVWNSMLAEFDIASVSLSRREFDASGARRVEFNACAMAFAQRQIFFIIDYIKYT